jgi:phosphatidylethanolamine/phosphatidyl-N-methylethanolamine N-methyltransferase
MTQPTLDESAIRRAYRRWAPFYDETFGVVAAHGRRAAVAHINTRAGRVLEVGVGTGLSLPRYKPSLDVTGIDLSEHMLDIAARRVRRGGLRNRHLALMDAGRLGFPDAAFETSVAMYVMTVVPDPVRVMREIERVTKPGGEVLIVNHFSREGGVRGFLERSLAPYADRLGWHPLFPVDRVCVCEGLTLVEQRDLMPFGLFSLLRFVKRA